MQKKRYTSVSCTYYVLSLLPSLHHLSYADVFALIDDGYFPVVNHVDATRNHKKHRLILNCHFFGQPGDCLLIYLRLHIAAFSYARVTLALLRHRSFLFSLHGHCPVGPFF